MRSAVLSAMFGAFGYDWVVKEKRFLLLSGFCLVHPIACSKTNMVVRQNLQWETCYRLQLGYIVASSAKQYDLIITTAKRPRITFFFSKPQYLNSSAVGPLRACRNLNSALFGQLLVLINLSPSSLVLVLTGD